MKKRLRAVDRAGTTTSAIRAIDLIPMGGPTQRAITQEGLVAPANISKVGIQAYRAGELGIPGMDANKVLYAYRPPNEVFDPEAVKSFQLNPLANDHTPDDVTPDNWRKYASEGRIAGDIRDVAPASDGKHLGAVLIVRDKKAIDDIVGGKSQLSCGYTFDADWTPGDFEGQHYDFVQRRIRGNHVAIVDLARGGYGCRIADRQPGTNRRTHMDFIPITINGVTIRVAAEDAANATVARDAYDKMSALHKSGCDALAEAKGHLDAMKIQHKAVVGRLGQKDDDEEEMGDKKGKDDALQLIDLKLAGVRAGLKKTADAAIAAATAATTAATQRATDAESKILTEAQIDALVAVKQSVVDGAIKLIGTEFKKDGKSIGAIRVEALSHVIAKDAALKPVAVAVLGATDLTKAESAASPLVTAAFDAVVAAKPAAQTRANDSSSVSVLSILAHDSGSAGAGAGRTAVLDMSDPQGTLRTREQNGGLIPGQAAGI